MPVTVNTEIERKYDVDGSTPVPDLSSMGELRGQHAVDLRAVYYDTADGALASRFIALRRRTGGKDEGWHIKGPAAEGRFERHATLDLASLDHTAPSDSLPSNETPATGPPRDLIDTVRAIVRDQELVEVARVTTHRSAILVLDRDGAAVVEVADDVVTATDLRTGILRFWREWEVELLDDAPHGRKKRAALLDGIEHQLLAAGATVSASASKLARALGRNSLAVRRSQPTLSKSSIALEVVSAVLSDLIEGLVVADPRARADEADGVHAFRTLVRRLRSVLTAFRSVLDREVTDGIRDRLKQLGSVLGAARDAEVWRIRALALLETNEHLRGDADLCRRLIDEPLDEYRAKHAAAVNYLNGTAYFRILDDLEGLVARPPVTEASMNIARDELHGALVAEARRTRKLAKRAASDDLTALHEARKAARRLRHAAEALSSGSTAIFGKKVRALAEVGKAVQDAIGDNRDALLFAGRLLETAHQATDAAENAANYGALVRLERYTAEAALGRYEIARTALHHAAADFDSHTEP